MEESAPETTPPVATDAPISTETPTPRETPTETATPERPTPDLTCEGDTLDTPTPDVNEWVWALADVTTLAEIATAVVEPASELESFWTVDGTPIRLEERHVFEQVRTGDTLTRTTIDGDIFIEPAYVSQNDTYYRIDERLVSQQPVTAHAFTLEQLRDGSERERTARQEAIPVSSLSSAEKKVFFTDLPTVTPLGSGGFTRKFAYHFESDTAADASRLVSDDVTYLEYEEVYFALQFEQTVERTQQTFEYEATIVATNESAFQDIVADVFVIDTTTLDLSTDTQTLLDHILSCGHYKETPRFSTEVLALLEVFADQQTKPGVDWKYYVDNESRLYELSLERR